MGAPDSIVLARWREQLWSTFVRLESTSEADNFFGTVERAAPDSCRLSFVRSTCHLTERDAGHIRSDPQEIVLMAVQRCGFGLCEQNDRQARTESGDFVLYDTTKPYRKFFNGPFEQLIVRLPRLLLDQRLSGLSHLVARRWGGSPAARLTVDFLNQLASAATSLGDRGIEAFEPAAADMIAAAIQLESDGSSVGERALLERVQRRLVRDIRDPGLNIRALAIAEGISFRTFQRLFYSRGTTPTRWVQDCRLSGIGFDLRAPGNSSRSIADIAFSWGFGDLSTFHRLFRAKYGMSPRVWRSGCDGPVH